MKNFLFLVTSALVFVLCSFCAASCGTKSTDALEYELTDGKNEYAVIGISDPTVTEIYIPENHDGLPVTEIKETAFYGNAAIEKAEMSNNIKKIGERAFYKCNNLKSVKLPDGLQELEDETFAYCHKLTDIKIPSGLLHIKNGVFKSCITLTQINIPSTVREIGDDAFYECQFSSVIIPNHVNAIGNRAFAHTCIENLTLGGNLYTIGDCAFFQCCFLTDLTIPDNVTHIGNQAFSGCINLENISLGKKVLHIGNDAFSGCKNLGGIVFPDDVETIGSGAFHNCENLSFASFRGQKITLIEAYTFSGCKIGTIEIPYSVEDIGQNAFDGCPCVQETNGLSYVDKWLVKCDETLSTAEIKADTVGIANNAFLKCYALTEITIPQWVKSIGRSAFHQCFGLKEIKVHPYNKNFKSVNGNLFNSNLTVLIYCIMGMNDAETEFAVPDTVTEIREFAFDNCPYLTTINISENVKKFGDALFYGCGALTDINYNGTESQWEEIEKGTLWEPKGCTVHCTDGDIRII